MNGIRKSFHLCVFVSLCFYPCVFAQTTSIQGTVTRGNTSEPLSKATVELRAEAPNSPLLDQTTTEGDGRFAFFNVRPAQYRLTVKRQGYVRSSPMSVTVAANQQSSEVRLPMTPAATIYGNVYDNKGAPFGNILVQAFKASYQAGQRTLRPVQSVRTNDLGEYRLFWLAPGRYYVAAIPTEAEPMSSRMLQLGGVGMTSQLGNNEFLFFSAADIDPAVSNPLLAEPQENGAQTDRYVPVYFPGTTSEGSATAIDAQAGTESGGVNIIVNPVRQRHVRGIVLDGATGKPPAYSALEVADDGPELMRPRESPEVDPNTGTFDVALLPGTHTLKATAEVGTGFITFQLGDNDLENVTIIVAPRLHIAGRIAVDGNSPTVAQLGDLRITLAGNAQQSRRPPASYSSPLRDGTFNLDGAAGDFRVNISPILNVVPQAFPSPLAAALQNVYVKSIRLGNVDVLNNGIRLQAQPNSTLDIVLGTRPGSLEGAAVNDNKQPVTDASVVLVPDLRSRSDLYFNLVSDSSGRFRFDRVPPGDYKMFAWTEVENGSWYDPDFMRNYEVRGMPIRIVDGGKQDVQVTPFP